MNLIKSVIILIILILTSNCANYSIEKSKKKLDKIYFSSTGFTLIYDDKYFENKTLKKKINNDEFFVMHDFLKKNTPVKIINPENSKIISTKINAKTDYPKIFNLVISKKIADELELDPENPYIELFELKKNATFIAKESNMFDEEKKVADVAPVEEIQMNNISNIEDKPTKLKKVNNFILVISDFYYIDSANNLKNELVEQTKINSFSVVKISNNKYRLSAGPFKNFNSLKSTYISLNNLGFEGLNIIKK